MMKKQQPDELIRQSSDETKTYFEKTEVPPKPAVVKPSNKWVKKQPIKLVRSKPLGIRSDNIESIVETQNAFNNRTLPPLGPHRTPPALAGSLKVAKKPGLNEELSPKQSASKISRKKRGLRRKRTTQTVIKPPAAYTQSETSKSRTTKTEGACSPRNARSVGPIRIRTGKVKSLTEIQNALNNRTQPVITNRTPPAFLGSSKVPKKQKSSEEMSPIKHTPKATNRKKQVARKSKTATLTVTVRTQSETSPKRATNPQSNETPKPRIISSSADLVPIRVRTGKVESPIKVPFEVNNRTQPIVITHTPPIVLDSPKALKECRSDEDISPTQSFSDAVPKKKIERRKRSVQTINTACTQSKSSPSQGTKTESGGGSTPRSMSPHLAEKK